MWAEIERRAPEFESAVLTGLDAQGNPYSLRCRPELDRDAQVLRVCMPTSSEIVPGPAGLLYHRHDERLSGLASFLVRGTLVQDGRGWAFHPLRYVPGVGVQGLRGWLRFVLDGRRNARRYLAKRGWSPPRDPVASLLADADLEMKP